MCWLAGVGGLIWCSAIFHPLGCSALASVLRLQYDQLEISTTARYLSGRSSAACCSFRHLFYLFFYYQRLLCNTFCHESKFIVILLFFLLSSNGWIICMKPGCVSVCVCVWVFVRMERRRPTNTRQTHNARGDRVWLPWLIMCVRTRQLSVYTSILTKWSHAQNIDGNETERKKTAAPTCHTYAILVFVSHSISVWNITVVQCSIWMRREKREKEKKKKRCQKLSDTSSFGKN